MQSDEQSSPLRVENAAQVAAFENPLRCRVLVSCGREERSLSDLHRLLGLSLSKLHYHVARLLAAKLLVVSRAQPRAGRAVRYYRAVAERFLVPQESMPAGPGDALATELRQSLQDELVREGAVSVLYAAGPEDGTMTMRLIRTESAASPRHMELWRLLKLDTAQRTALAKELAAVLERYATAGPRPGAEAYLAHAAFAPRRKDLP
jgi:DNA-binding transcriptional ArsR family regulator